MAWLLFLSLNWRRRSTSILSDAKQKRKKKHIVQNLLAVSERIYSPTTIHNPATCAIVHLLHGILHCSWLYCVLNRLDVKTGIWIFYYLFVWYCLSVSLYLLLFSFYVPSSPVLFLSSCPSHPSIPPPSELSEIHTHRLPTRERESELLILTQSDFRSNAWAHPVVRGKAVNH